LDVSVVKSSPSVPYERRIVVRTRLLAALGRSEGRTVILLAPAGYGKTTLARQWIERSEGAWVALTSASADIPVLARDLAAALGQLGAFDTQRVEIALQAARTPADQAVTVARTILGQVSEPVGWIVLDDYQYIAGNSAAEELIGRLERSRKFRFLVTSRERPQWATSRRRVHLEMLELGAAELALDEREVAQLLPPDRRTAALRREARGWPAVIGLAAHARLVDIDLTPDSLSEQLYDYLAEELFECAGEDVQRWLATLAVLPRLRPAELDAFLGSQGASQEVITSGLAYEAGGLIDVHPLAKDFLLAKLMERPEARDVSGMAFDLALAKGQYDVGLEIVKNAGLDDRLERLIVQSYRDLIEVGRVETLARFSRYAVSRGAAPKPLVDLIGAEVALKGGDVERGDGLAKSALRALDAGHPLRGRASLLAGRAAHLAYRFEEAYACCVEATESCATEADRSDAAWGVVQALVYLEDDRAELAIAGLEALKSLRPKDIVRLDYARLLEWWFGGTGRSPELDNDVAELARTLSDPWVRSSWFFFQSAALVLNARYDEAVKLLRSTLSDLGEFGLVFATPRVKWTLAAAELGRRHFSWCEAHLRAVERNAGLSRDVYLELNVRALRARMALTQQQGTAALELTRDDFGEGASRAMYGEYLATRALALAVIGHDADAIDAAGAANAVTRSVDARVLAAAARSVVSLSDAGSADNAAVRLLETASASGAWDGVVCAIRSRPDLLARLVEFGRYRIELQEVLTRSNDARLARSVGLVAPTTSSPGRLTPREREVMEHVAQGKRNAEIAESLFITVATVKRHLDRAYDKLGARGRMEATARYAEIVIAERDDSPES
jgi:ATP/maltotriose-dependent transcriptional regulator MalT